MKKCECIRWVRGFDRNKSLTNEPNERTTEDEGRKGKERRGREGKRKGKAMVEENSVRNARDRMM